MKKHIFPAFMILVFSLSLKAQTPDLTSKKEISIAFTYQRDQAQGEREGNWFMSLPLRYTYFFTKNIGIGAEVILSDSKLQENVASILNGMVEADWPYPLEWQIIPFLNAGYGYSNGSFPFDRLAVKSFNSVNVWVVNIGGGVKVPVADNVLLRMEYRFQNFSGKGTDVSSFGIREAIDVDQNYSFFWAGFSLLY